MAFSSSKRVHSELPEAPGCGHHESSEVKEKVEDRREVGPIEKSIVDKIQEEFHPSHFEIRNDSWMHQHHRAMQGAKNMKESHFSMVIVSDKFRELKSLPSRHRYVYKVLEEEMVNRGVHAIQMKTKTVEEFTD
ncbi:hypothetical protein FOA43_002106 [Brettanomyces nanus]|uniref:BolA family transcriptional regulator n=1 Tax=Eeniella nana TaxID=13502 RepID=A0A875S3Y1_EENNA|nr:uncharacterized protein FOA43_002106 [Brettanomyces nanus]QPG74772.1 hypothetical protein FOA43_002106 [Brettanomyces nanus]